MKYVKKLLAVALAAVLALSMFTACGKEKVPVDLQTSREILETINARRSAGGMQTLTLSEDASLPLGNWAKAAAESTQKGAKAVEEAARSAARKAVTEMKIDGKAVFVYDTYTFYNVSGAEQVARELQEHPNYFITAGEEAGNYAAVASYSDGEKAAVVVMLLKVK